MTTLQLALRFALREMRGGLRGFRIFLACLALGVAAIAAAASLNESVKAGIAANARPLLGGDLQARLTNAPATDAEMAAFLGQLYNREVSGEDLVTVIRFSEIRA